MMKYNESTPQNPTVNKKTNDLYNWLIPKNSTVNRKKNAT